MPWLPTGQCRWKPTSVNAQSNRLFTTPYPWKAQEKVCRIHLYIDTGIHPRNPSTNTASLYWIVRARSGCQCCLHVYCFSKNPESPAALLCGCCSDIPSDAGVHPSWIMDIARSVSWKMHPGLGANRISLLYQLLHSHGS